MVAGKARESGSRAGSSQGDAPAPGADIAIGVVGPAFGRRGEVFVEPLNGDPERFGALRSARVGRPGGPAVSREIASCRVLKGRPALRFAGVEDISAAEALRGHELRIAESEREELPEGVFYFDELIGCRAESAAGESFGEVVGVSEAGGGSLLVLRRADGGESLIPFVEGICPVVDPEAGRIVMDPPDGLLRMNG